MINEIDYMFTLFQRYSSPEGIVLLWEHLGDGDREAGANWDNKYGDDGLESQVRQIIYNALIEHHWRQDMAARSLGISARRINHYVKKYGWKHASWKVNR